MPQGEVVGQRPADGHADIVDRLHHDVPVVQAAQLPGFHQGVALRSVEAEESVGFIRSDGGPGGKGGHDGGGLGGLSRGRRVDADDGGRVGQLGQRVDAVGYQRQSGRRLVFRDDFAAELAGQTKRLDGRGVELRRGVFLVQDIDFVLHDGLGVAGSVAVGHGCDVNIPDRPNQRIAEQVFVEEADTVE